MAVEEKIKQEDLKSCMKQNELLDLEIAMKKISIEREKLELQRYKNKKT